MPDIGNAITSAVVSTINGIILFIPLLISGLIILALGWMLASFLKVLAKKLFDAIGIDSILVKMGVEERKSSAMVWSEIASQVVFWFVFLAFLIPAFNAWQLSNITTVLNQVLLFLPNVFAAVFIGFIGFLFGNIAYNLVRNAAKGIGASKAIFLGNVAKFGLYIFTGLVVLNQLQIASNLIQLLLAGFVAMAALAGGLAFGLGGQEAAREMLRRFMHIKAERRIGMERGREPMYASEIRPRRSKKSKKSA